MIYIYGLVCPKINEIRYIGKSIRPKARFVDHLNDKSKTHKVNWIQSLLKSGLKPSLIILEELPNDGDWISSEISWIKKAKKNNWNLVNSTDGGDGVLNISGEGKKRMLATWKGRKHKPETLLKLSKASKGRVKNTISKKLLSEKMAGRKITWKDKLQESVRKFDDNKLLQVKKDLDNGMKVCDAAIKYCVHRTTITKIKIGQYKTFKQKTVNYIKPRLFHNK